LQQLVRTAEQRFCDTARKVRDTPADTVG